MKNVKVITMSFGEFKDYVGMVANGGMNNKAICRKTDEHFTEGKEYECTAAYSRYESAVVDILDNNKELITCEINDKDFQFVFN